MKCVGHYRSQSNKMTSSPNHKRSVGGKREDLGGMYFRSRWEANYARYLNWLISIGQIEKWEYEPRVFLFPVKRGNTSYTPDFKIEKKDGSCEWHEIKGWMDKDSATKLKRMSKYYPEEVVIVLGKKEYGAIAKEVRNFIPGWEHDSKHGI